MGLLYMLALWSNVCFIWALDSMVVRDRHSLNERSDIISSVGHLRSDSVMLLVLCMVACNSWGTDIVLQVPQDSANPVENG
jgi:hypothetical protein